MLTTAENRIVNPAPMVARTESLEAIGRARKQISADYQGALDARQQGLARGLQVGRAIILASLDNEVAGAVQRVNRDPANPGKYRPGTPVRVYAWVAREIARGTRYNWEYLCACARQYMAAANRHTPDLLVLQAGGVLRGAISDNLPSLSDIKPFLTLPTDPRMEAATEESETETEDAPETPDEMAQRLARPFLKTFRDAQGHTRLAFRERLAVMKRVNCILNPLGFEIAALATE
jgi:hypothetical protein